MDLIQSKTVRYLAMAAIVLMIGKSFAQSDTTSSKPSTYSPYSSLMYSPYSSMMSSMYSHYSPSMAASMVMPYYSSAYSPYTQSAGAATGYGHSSSYHPSQYMMAASYPHAAYVPMPYAGGYGSYGGYSPISGYYG